jgi:uncharacterized protein YodC (DUF2158 family)
MRKVLFGVVGLVMLMGTSVMAQTTCKRFTVSSSEGCIWCEWYNPFSNRKTVTTSYHFVCSDGSSSYSSQTVTYGCGTC